MRKLLNYRPFFIGRHVSLANSSMTFRIIFSYIRISVTLKYVCPLEMISRIMIICSHLLFLLFNLLIYSFTKDFYYLTV